MVNVCQQCGDIGFTEALAYCMKCKSAAIHSYCLEEIPEDLNAETIWLCEDCKSMSPNYASKAKFPTTVDVGILDLGSGKAQIGIKNICQEIGPANDRLFNSHDQHPVSNLRIGSGVNMDNHVSYDLKRKALSCPVGGAVATVSKNDGFKPKVDGVEECDKENSKRKGLMLSDKDNLDNSQSPVNAQDKNIVFAPKRLPDTSVEASDIQIIGGTSNFDIGGLENGRSSVCFGLKEEETDESEKEKSKKSGLVLPDKDELNNFHSLISGEGTNFSLAVKTIPGTSVEPSDSQITRRTARCSTHKLQAVESSPCYKQKGDELEEHAKRRTKSDVSILQTNNFNHLIDGHGTNCSFIVKRLPDTSVERSDRNTIGMTLSNDTKTLDAVKASVCCMPKEDDIEEYEKKIPKGRYIVSCKDTVDQLYPVFDGQGNNISFSVERLVRTSIESSDNKTSKRTSYCRNSALDALVSSTCVKFKGGQLEKEREKPMMRVIVPGLDQLDDIQPPINGQGSNITFAAKRLSGTSIKISSKQTTLSTLCCDVGAVGVVRPSDHFGLKESEINAHSKKKKKRRRPRGKRVIPLVKGERDNFHRVIFCQGKNIPVLAKRVPGTSAGVSDGQVIGRIETSDRVGAIRSSVSFELDIREIDEYRKERSGSRSLSLSPENELNSLHSVIDKRGTVKFSAERSLGTFVEPSDRQKIKWMEAKAEIMHSVIDKRGTVKFPAESLLGTSVEPSDRQKIKLMETKAEKKFPCQLTSPSLFVDPHVWRGCFNINKAELGPVTANLSRTACVKVCNFARKLPLVLHMQKFPRLVAWPNSFKLAPPTVDKVALYFFPESDRVEAVLDDLVDDIINNDLMLRFQFDEVELLVFSSFVLPQEHQMFFGKYYPWGVFRPRSAMICSFPAGSHAGYQVGEALKPVRSEEEDHKVGSSNYSCHEANDFTLKQYSIHPKEENLMVIADSTNACEEEKLQTLGRKPSWNVWQREEQLDDCKKKLGFEMSKTYASELKEAAEEIKRELMG